MVLYQELSSWGDVVIFWLMNQWYFPIIVRCLAIVENDLFVLTVTFPWREKTRMLKQIDLNSDVGESFGAYKIGLDERVIPLISSANIACGFHAGDPLVI